MTTTILPNLDKLTFQVDSSAHYGGAQDMYQTKWQQLSGCGPTSISNLFTYLSLTKKQAKSLFPYDNVNENHMLEQMESLWRFVTPTVGGVNKIEILALGGERFASSRQVPIKAHSLPIDKNRKKRADLETVTHFLLQSLENGSPIAFLNLDNGNVPHLQNWHWILIVGIGYNKNHLSITAFDEGNKVEIDLDKWLELTNNKGGFVSFELL